MINTIKNQTVFHQNNSLNYWSIIIPPNPSIKVKLLELETQFRFVPANRILATTHPSSLLRFIVTVIIEK